MEILHFLQLAVLGLVLYLVLELVRFNSRKNSIKRPPSPFSIPVLGHIHLLGKLPHVSLHNLSRKYGGFMYLKLGTVDTLVVSSAPAAKEVLKVQDHILASRPRTIAPARYNSAGLAWASYCEEWRKMRKLCTLELLSARRVESLQPFRRIETQIFLAHLLALAKHKSEVNLTTQLKDVTFNTMTRMVMNKSYSSGALSKQERDEALFFKNTIITVITLAASMHIGDFFPKIQWMDRQAHKIKVLTNHLDNFMDKQLKEHSESFKHGQAARDFLDVMISTPGLSKDSILAISLDIIGAGTDTSAVTVEWAMSELMNNPAVMKKAQKELLDVVGPHRMVEEADLNDLHYLQAIIKETFRLHPAAPLLLPHESTQAFEVWGFSLPAKTRIMVNVYAIGRDESIWKEPTKFDPERFLGNSEMSSVDVKGQDFELLPFGSGRRSCPGMLLGVTSVKYILASLLHAFDWHIPEDRSGLLTIDMSEEFGLSVGRASPLTLVPSPRLSPEAYSFS